MRGMSSATEDKTKRGTTLGGSQGKVARTGELARTTCTGELARATCTGELGRTSAECPVHGEIMFRDGPATNDPRNTTGGVDRGITGGDSIGEDENETV
mmetsp:Transcript_106199/g.165790  ORF Transcript_106199/g.165790 Transcript_106199/m.165790 type:complete len:99 (+) Transcript_106199:651-947(+)